MNFSVCGASGNNVEDAVKFVDILIEVNDVTSVSIDKLGYNGDNARLVGAVHEKYRGIFFLAFHFDNL